jgi:hypothetical protein
LPKASPIFPTFSSGEVSPLLYGRVDLQQYFNGLQEAENCLVRPYGLIMNRPGLQYIAETKDSTKKARLLEFIFNESDAFIIEMGEFYFRFYTLGAQVAGPYEVAHTYTEAEIPDVHYAQINDVIFLVHKDHKPATLTRMAVASWALADITFIGGPVQDENTTATTITPSADTGAGITLTASASIFTANHVGSIWKVKDGFVTITAFSTGTSVTADVATGDNLGTGPGATTEWSEAAWSDEAGWPATITFHERRAWYARTDTQPQTEWASKPFIYDDFTAGPNDDDALVVTLNTELANDIKWLSSGTTLATGTFGGEFITSSGTNGISLTPSNVNSIRQTGWGSRNIQPKKIGNFTYYVQRGGRKIRELFYYWDLDTYKSVDMTIISEHITESGVLELAYQQNPDSTLWCVLENGRMAAFVREDDQQIQAWTPQTTDGLFESVAAIPSNEGPYDEVWTIVNRTISGTTKRYIERFANPLVPDRQEDCFYVDSGLTLNVYDGTSAVTLTLSAVTGTGVTATASGAYFAANDVGQRIRAIDADGNFVGELLITTFTSTTIVEGNVTSDFDSTTYGTNEWGVSVNDISGLAHLEGKEVSILADGAVQTSKTVSGGSITMERDGFEMSIGLPYTSRVKTLSIEAGSATGTAQGKRKRIYQLGLNVYKTLGIKVGSNDNNLFLVNLRNPSTPMGTAEPLVSGIIPNLRSPGGWTWEAEVLIVQENPYPMHILDIIPLMKTEDR